MIRLARRGKKNRPFFRVVVSEKSKDMYSDALEIVGSMSPIAPKSVELNGDRIRYWLSKGAQASPRVHNLLVVNKVIDAPLIKKAYKKVAPAVETKA